MQQLSSLMGGMGGSLTREDMRSAFEAGPQVGPLAAVARALLPAGLPLLGPCLAAGQSPCSTQRGPCATPAPDHHLD